MAIKTVKVQVNGAWAILEYNPTTKNYEGTIAAPSKTSFNKPGRYYPVLVEVEDLAGNKTTKTDTDATLGDKCKLFVKEVTKPKITKVSPSNNAYVTTSKPDISFDLIDEDAGGGASGINIATLRLKVNSNTYTADSPGMTINQLDNGVAVNFQHPFGLDDGVHTFSINVQDRDGNKADEVSRSFTIDTVPPSLIIHNPAETGMYVNKAAFTVSGHTNDATSSPVTVTIKLNGVDQGAVTVDGSGNFTKSITLREGSNSIVIRATDAAGKYSEASSTIILDTVAPTISNITIVPNPVNVGQSYTITVEATDD